MKLPNVFWRRGLRSFSWLELSAQFQSRNNGVGAKVEHRGHLACHAEAAVGADVGAFADAVAARTVGIDEISYPTPFFESHVFHLFESRHGVHYRISFALVGYHFVDYFVAQRFVDH